MSETNGNGHGNALAVVQQPSKKLGGATGKGFLPGKSGNPAGRQKGVRVFGAFVRHWLEQHAPKSEMENVWNDRTVSIHKRKRRLQLLIEGLIKDGKKDVLLHYAYGKPVQAVELSQAEGSPIEFVVKVSNKELP